MPISHQKMHLHFPSDLKVRLHDQLVPTVHKGRASQKFGDERWAGKKNYAMAHEKAKTNQSMRWQ